MNASVGSEKMITPVQEHFPVEGMFYRVIKEFVSIGDSIMPGTSLKYTGKIHSAYDSMTQHRFVDAAGEIRVFEIRDGTDPTVLREIIEPTGKSSNHERVSRAGAR